MKQPKEKKYRKKTNHNYGKIFGIILITLGIILLFIPLSLNLKISASLIFIGFVIILMTNKKDTPKAINDIQLILIIIIITLVAWIITIDADYEIFIISITIGIIALKELLDKFLSPYLRKRINILSYILLILFIIIVVLSFPKIGTH